MLWADASADQDICTVILPGTVKSFDEFQHCNTATLQSESRVVLLSHVKSC